MAATQRRVRRATAAQVSWFRANEQRSEAILRDVLAKKGGARFAGLSPDVKNYIERFLSAFPHKTLTQIRRLGAQPVTGRPFGIPTTAVATSFKEEILDGIHAAADVYKIALFLAASTIGPATATYSAANNEVAAGGGYTQGGINLAGRQIVTDGTTKILDWTTDPVWPASTITARGCQIYNSSKANRSVGVFDFGADVASTNGNFQVTLPNPTAAAGAIRIA